MQFEKPLLPGRLIKRYKRFLADIAFDNGDTTTAHCANPGAMMGITAPGLPVWCSLSDDPKRKLKYSWEVVEIDEGRGPVKIGVNTGLPNRLVTEALEAGAIGELTGYDKLRREVRYGENSRIDVLLERDGAPPCYVEVKNVHLMREPGLAEFPDSVTTRGAKHLGELARVVRDGGRAVMLYVVQRGDCERFSLAGDLDPAYAQAFADAHAAGVEAICYDCTVSAQEITLRTPLEVVVA